MAQKDVANGHIFPVSGDIERGIGQLPPEKIVASSDFEPENFILRAIHEVWNWRLLNKVRDYFVETFVFEGSSMASAERLE